LSLEIGKNDEGANHPKGWGTEKARAARKSGAWPGDVFQMSLQGNPHPFRGWGFFNLNIQWTTCPFEEVREREANVPWQEEEPICGWGKPASMPEGRGDSVRAPFPIFKIGGSQNESAEQAY